MRKTVIVFLVVSVLLNARVVPASDSSVDFSGKSVEELVEIRKDVDEALFEAGGATVIQYGEYVAGTDIAPGTYTINIYNKEENLAGLYITIWKSKDLEAQYEVDYNTYWEAYYKAEDIEEAGGTAEYPVKMNGLDYYTVYEELIEIPGGSYHFTLEDGQVLELGDWCGNVNIVIEKAAGLFME